MLDGTLDANKQRRLSLGRDQVSKLQKLKIMTLAVTFWRHNETVLDVGYSECTLESTVPQITRHWNINENRRFNDKQRAVGASLHPKIHMLIPGRRLSSMEKPNSSTKPASAAP